MGAVDRQERDNSWYTNRRRICGERGGRLLSAQQNSKGNIGRRYVKLSYGSSADAHPNVGNRVVR